MAKIFLAVAHVNFDVGDVALARNMPNVFVSIVERKYCKQLTMSACSKEKKSINCYPGSLMTSLIFIPASQSIYFWLFERVSVLMIVSSGDWV